MTGETAQTQQQVPNQQTPQERKNPLPLKYWILWGATIAFAVVFCGLMFANIVSITSPTTCGWRGCGDGLGGPRITTQRMSPFEAMIFALTGESLVHAQLFAIGLLFTITLAFMVVMVMMANLMMVKRDKEFASQVFIPAIIVVAITGVFAFVSLILAVV